MEHVASLGVYNATARGDKMEQYAEVEPKVEPNHLQPALDGNWYALNVSHVQEK